MFLIKPSYEILSHTTDALKLIDQAGRTCYKSEDKITNDSAEIFVNMISGRGHLSVVEHASMTVKFIVDRGVTHEIVRHRIASYSQESTRYCCYGKEKFRKRITYIIPSWCKICPGTYNNIQSVIDGNPDASPGDISWANSMLGSEISYLDLLNKKWSAQEARSVLPNSLKTEIVMTTNMREWQHVFKLRCSTAAHPQMREIMIPLQQECARQWPAIFKEI
jgi:thymidylate synthase (FAD)